MLYPEYGDFEEQTGALIKVVGVGGGGGNACLLYTSRCV